MRTFQILFIGIALLFALADANSSNASVTGDGKLKGEGNYADITIYYTSGSSVIDVRNAWISWGKWVPGQRNYHDEIGSPNGMSMTAWGEYHIASAGRENSPSGTEASIDIYSGYERVLYLYWNVVYGGMADCNMYVFSNNFRVKWTRIGESYLLLTLVIEAVGGVDTVSSIA